MSACASSPRCFGRHLSGPIGVSPGLGPKVDLFYSHNGCMPRVGLSKAINRASQHMRAPARPAAIGSLVAAGRDLDKHHKRTGLRP
jgi:hypothetical protein